MKRLNFTKRIPSVKSYSLAIFIKEVGKVDLLTQEEEVHLARRIKMGDQAALAKLINANLRFVISVASQYQGLGLEIDDLINEGNFGLVHAAQRFDESRQVKFISYAVWWIRQTILQAINEKSRVVRLPANRVSTSNKIAEKSLMLEKALMREPTFEELSSASEMTETVITNGLKYGNHRELSIDSLCTEGSQSILDKLEFDTEELPDSNDVSETQEEKLRALLSNLTKRESELIISSRGLFGSKQLSTEQLGIKFSLTKDRVRQIISKAELKMINKNKRS